MKRSLQAIVTLFFVLCTFVFTEPLHAWWSYPPRTTHFNFITLSKSKLNAAGLFDNDTLKTASMCPDGPNQTIDHKDPIRLKLNFCATVGMALTGAKNGPVNCKTDCKSTIDCMGRTFHYLHDLADSTHADGHYVDSRNYAHDHFDKIKSDPGMGQKVQDYNHAMARYNTNSVVNYNSLVKYIQDTTSFQDTSSSPKGKSLKDELRTANKQKKGITRDTARDKVFVKNFALIEAGQDKLIDLYEKELSANASGICVDTPAYCRGLEKQIDQACRIKNVTAVKKYLQLAKEAKALKQNDPGCKNLQNMVYNEKKKLQECSTPVTPVVGRDPHTGQPISVRPPSSPTRQCQRVCIQWLEKWLNASDGRHSLCAGGVPRPPGPGLLPPKCELSRQCVKSENRCN